MGRAFSFRTVTSVSQDCYRTSKIGEVLMCCLEDPVILRWHHKWQAIEPASLHAASPLSASVFEQTLETKHGGATVTQHDRYSPYKKRRRWVSILRPWHERSCKFCAGFSHWGPWCPCRSRFWFVNSHVIQHSQMISLTCDVKEVASIYFNQFGQLKEVRTER